MRHLGLAFLALLPLIQGCDSPADQTEAKLVSARVINGVNIGSDNPAAKFNVFYTNDRGGNCSGSLIASNVVLTAAHCVNTAKASDLKILMGGQADSRRPDQVKIYARDILSHPGWKGLNKKDDLTLDQDDLALIILKEPVGSDFKPIAIFDGPLPPNFEQFPLEVYGYSAFTTNSSIDLADYFRDITRESYPSYYSRHGIYNLVGKLLPASENPYKAFGENYISVGQLGGGICGGDSGGPMVVNIDGEKVQIGVNDSTITIKGGEIDCSSQSISTYIYPYIPWINETLAKINIAPVVTKHFATPEGIAPANDDTYCIYTQGNVTSFLETSKENIKNNICDKKLITDLEEYMVHAEAYCTTDLSHNYQDALKATIQSVSANCQ